jgi:hypothetical protein
VHYIYRGKDRGILAIGNGVLLLIGTADLSATSAGLSPKVHAAGITMHSSDFFANELNVRARDRRRTPV